MKLLILSRYDRRGASSRLRMFQFVPALEAAGFEVQTAAFFDDDYLAALYGGRQFPLRIAGHYLRRARQLSEFRDADVLWVEKELFPWLPWQLERLFLRRGCRLVTDYDDAVFHRYDLHESRAVRALLGRKIDRAMGASDLVLAGNDYLGDRALAAGAQRIQIIPTVVDVGMYAAGRSAGDGRTRVGWIGTPGTWRRYGVPMMPLLSGVAARHGILMRVVGGRQEVAMEDPFEFLPWSEAREIADIQGMDIGIMPLDDTPWSRGKCGYKLIQYMACGLPVVASPVGVNAEIVEHGVNGFLASTAEEWRDALERLLRDEDLRRRMGEAGRRKVERNYSLQRYGLKVAELLRGLVDEDRPNLL